MNTETAFDVFYEKWSPALYGLITNLITEKSRAEELFIISCTAIFKDYMAIGQDNFKVTHLMKSSVGLIVQKSCVTQQDVIGYWRQNRTVLAIAV